MERGLVVCTDIDGLMQTLNINHNSLDCFNIILHLRLYLLSGLFSLEIYVKTLYIFIIFPLLPVCVTNLIFHGYLLCTSSRPFNRPASAETRTSNDRVDNLLRFGKHLAGSNSLFWDVTLRRMVVCNQSTLHNIPDEQVSRFHHGGILISLIFWTEQQWSGRSCMLSLDWNV